MPLKSELSKADKTIQRLKALQKFVSDRISQDVAYSEVLQTLNQLEGSLKSVKLPVQIVSQNQLLAQTLQSSLDAHLSGQGTYLFATGVLPKLPDPAMPLSSPVLILQSMTAESEQHTRYELSTPEIQVIGRHPNCQIRLANDLTRVGGHHAELRSTLNSEQIQWQLCDLNSKNGTYINGDRLQNCQTLQNGDLISLGSPSLTGKSATLVFECQTPEILPSFETDANYRQLFDGMAVCLVIDPTQPISNTDKHFIAQAAQTAISKLIVIAAMASDSILEPVKANLAKLQTWMNERSHQVDMEVMPLVLPANLESTVLMPHPQNNFEPLCQSLEAVVQGNAEDILVRHIMTRFEAQMKAIEEILRTQEASLMQNSEQGEQSKELPPNILREQSRKLLGKISTEKDFIFRQIKAEVTQSKAKLLDDLRRSSLPYKVQEFLATLEFVETRQQGYCYIRLKVGNALEPDADVSVVHLAAMHLIKTELKQWTTDEWRRIYNSYSDGGINRLIEKSDETLSAIPRLERPRELFHQPQKLIIEPILQTSVVQPFCETRYKHITIGGYLVKNIRMQAMQWVGLFTMVAGSLMLLLPEHSSSTGNLRGYILLVVLPIIAPCLFFSYKHERKEKSQEAVERLQKDLMSHYQSIVKSLADKLGQYLVTVVESEERQFKDILETINDQFSELERNQLQLKAQLEESKRVQQRNIASLSRDVAEFQKLQQEFTLGSR